MITKLYGFHYLINFIDENCNRHYMYGKSSSILEHKTFETSWLTNLKFVIPH